MSTNNINLSEAFAELEKIVSEFEQGQVDLESGIPKFKRGFELAKELKTRLEVLEKQIIEIKEQVQENKS